MEKGQGKLKMPCMNRESSHLVVSEGEIGWLAVRGFTPMHLSFTEKKHIARLL
jgi:hypothetical protein